MKTKELIKLDRSGGVPEYNEHKNITKLIPQIEKIIGDHDYELMISERPSPVNTDSKELADNDLIRVINITKRSGQPCIIVEKLKEPDIEYDIDIEDILGPKPTSQISRYNNIKGEIEKEKLFKLAITIPAYNEEDCIGKVISEIPRKIEGIDEIEIIVINDGSTDRTAEVAKEAGADRIISHPLNSGVGKAFSSGLRNALESGADIIVNIDADGQFDPKDIHFLVEPILKNEAEFVTASRFLDKKLVPDMPFIKKFGNGLFTWTISKITGQTFSDTQCGFRAFSRRAALKLNLFSRFTYTQEVFLDLVNKDLAIKEVPIKVIYFKNRRSRVVTNPISYGFKALGIITRTIRDARPLLFFGSFSLVFLITGTLSGLFLILRWMITGRVSPYTSLVNLSGVLLIVGFMLGVLALMADMLNRQRKIQEEILFFNKMQVYSNGN